MLRKILNPLLYSGLIVLVSACGDDVAEDPSDGGAQDTGSSAPEDGGSATVRDASSGGNDEYCPVLNYSECGGDLLGTWAFLALCPEDPEAAAALCEHPFDDRPICMGAGNEAICDGQQTGTLTFKSDGTIDIDTTITLVATWHFTDDCLAAVQTGATPAERCANVGNDRLACSYEGSCTCVGDPIIESDTNTATYEVTGNEVTLGDDPPSTYCIDGDLLTMDYYLFHPISWRYWVLERVR